MSERCKACGEDLTYPLWADQDGGQWERCCACGSDSSSHTWAEALPRYDAEYIRTHARGKTPEEVQADMRANLDWFQDHAGSIPGRDFLDVGCSEGAGLRGMAERGWAVHGFDIIPAAKEFSPPGDHITVAPTFRANLFPRRFAAVLCREVIEHVPGWRDFLCELHAATLPKGLLQLQTPRPTATFNDIGYQAQHLQLLSPLVVRYWSERIGFDVLDYRTWDLGQVFLLRRV